MLTITQGADEALAILRESAEALPDSGGVRITHEGTEDGEPAFAIALVAGPEDGDVVLDGHAMQVFVDPAAAGLLEDSALDGQAHGDHVHLGFVERDNLDGDAAA
jgi:Fe-S cluster assembly iron-binding protein IscA